MKTIGIGVDIENIERFNGLAIKRDSQFLNKIYTKDELKYCFSHKNPAPHLAARFAGKEAVIKAISKGFNKIISAKDVEITNAPGGTPSAKISHAPGRNLRVLISLSHCEDKAIAFAIIQT